MKTIYPFVVRSSNTGRIWRVGRIASLWNLVSAWNHATDPALPMSDWEHHRAKQYARALKNRMNQQGYILGKDYRELSNGSLWPNRFDANR